MDKLLQGLSEIGIPQNEIPNLAEKMNTYVKELQLFNKAYDLINTDDYEEIVVRHILDSLSAYKPLLEIITGINKPKNNLIIADIGSGGGLPGIPLAAAMGDFKFMLIERMTKRCTFLENCSAVLGLKNVEIQNQQAERIPRESFDIVVFRAFRPLDKKMTHILTRIRKPNGKIAAYKAKLSKITEEMNNIHDQVPDYKIIPLSVPFLTNDHERNLVVI